MIYGSQAFVAEIKERFLGDNKQAELPQHNSMLQEIHPALLLNQALAILEFDIASARNAGKIGSAEKDNRDLLVYLLRQAGRLSNREIGDHFGLTYSAVSRRVKIIADKLQIDDELSMKYENLKSKIKV